MDWKDKRMEKAERHKMQKAKEQQETGGGGTGRKVGNKKEDKESQKTSCFKLFGPRQAINIHVRLKLRAVFFNNGARTAGYHA